MINILEKPAASDFWPVAGGSKCRRNAYTCLSHTESLRRKPLSECVEKKNQLDVTECFIALMIRLTCFGHFYAHHQELETICVLLPPMVCSV